MARRLRQLPLLALVLGVIPGLVLAGAAAAGPAAAAPAPSGGAGLRVMTWNIQYGVPLGGDEPDLERVAAVIRSEDPDVVTLNEVHQDGDGLPGGHGDQPAELAALLAQHGYRYSYYAATETIPSGHDDGSGPGCGVHSPGEGTGGAATSGPDAAYTCGNMVLSKYPFPTGPGHPDGPEHVTLPTDHADPGGRDRRGMLGVTVRVPALGDVRVFVTHHSAPATQAHVEDQKAQVATVLEHIGAVDDPTLLAGDFNMRPADAAGVPTANSLLQSRIADAGLIDTWTRVADSSDGVTVPGSHGRPDGDHPDRRIDYVYASPNLTVRDAHVSLVDREAADHLAVVTDLQVRRPPVVAHAAVPAGTDGTEGWGQAAVGPGGGSLTACKNAGTDTDDGTLVRASLHRPGTDPAVRTVEDGGTSRDRCTTEHWHGRLTPGTTLRACVVRGEEVLGCREERVG
ncbi:endonuclease/exonuclease/phosphatase family protein [Georgenia alba]|uniref:Endonuclease/exonuclease/phosphatase family protein n=1 Tax=Georgenia alba TaxID=2233858 RepID=A0ABW2Q8H8_9MICO